MVNIFHEGVENLMDEPQGKTISIDGISVVKGDGNVVPFDIEKNTQNDRTHLREHHRSIRI